MGTYIYGIVGAAAVIGIMESILPRGGKTGAYMKLITSLCLLCLVVKPVGAVLRDLPDLLAGKTEAFLSASEAEEEEYRAILDGQIEATVKEQLQAAVREELFEEFSVENCDVGVVLEKSEDGWRVVRVAVNLTGRDIFRDPYAIETHLGTLLDCDCTVTVG